MYACMHGPGERIPFPPFLRRLWLKGISFCHGFESCRCLGWGGGTTTRRCVKRASILSPCLRRYLAEMGHCRRDMALAKEIVAVRTSEAKSIASWLAGTFGWVGERKRVRSTLASLDFRDFYVPLSQMSPLPPTVGPFSFHWVWREVKGGGGRPKKPLQIGQFVLRRPREARRGGEMGRGKEL